MRTSRLRTVLVSGSAAALIVGVSACGSDTTTADSTDTSSDTVATATDGAAAPRPSGDAAARVARPPTAPLLAAPRWVLRPI